MFVRTSIGCKFSSCSDVSLHTEHDAFPFMPTALKSQKQAEEEEEYLREQERYEREAREAQDGY